MQEQEAGAKTKHFGLIMAVYLLGLIVGGLYVGMVAPVRTVVQADFGIGNAQGIWIISIYALFYAAFIPVIAKAADRIGRKPIFLGCMIVFCIGAAICGASSWLGSTLALESGAGFIVLLAGRVLQAIGACGIIPLANAEIGSSAPPEKRGFALGITAAASGLSNVLGAGVGSAIIAAVGQSDWPILFYVCIPFGLIAIIGGAAVLPKGEGHATGKTDFFGSALVVVTVFLLLLGIQFISDPGEISFVDPAILIGALFAAAIVGLIVLVFAERKASDPIIDPKFFSTRPMLITLGVSLFIGAMINSMTLVPEFAEAALHMDVGTGGVFMVVIGVFSLAGPPMGGKLIDKFGPKPVLLSGLSVATLGYLILAFFAAPYPSFITLSLGFAVMGLGLGFCMGAPVNYMVFENVRMEEINSALGTATLVRQVGISVAPAIYLAFVTTGIGSIGYAPMFIATAVSSGMAIILTLFYKKKRA